jgi:transposase
MQVEHPVCCGIDVHKDTLTACLRRVDAHGQVSKEKREFATTSTALLTLSDWLAAQHCPVVAMESTGVYWKPVYHVLVGTVEVFIGNAYALRKPTVSLDVISLVASSCGYYKRQIEPHAAQ